MHVGHDGRHGGESSFYADAGFREDRPIQTQCALHRRHAVNVFGEQRAARERMLAANDGLEMVDVHHQSVEFGEGPAVLGRHVCRQQR
jgi:hypothetical protein